MNGFNINPMMAMGLGMLGGNQGNTAGQAFGNAMQGGFANMMAMQQAQHKQKMQDLQTKMLEWQMDQMQQEEQRRRQAAEQMAPMLAGPLGGTSMQPAPTVPGLGGPAPSPYDAMGGPQAYGMGEMPGSMQGSSAAMPGGDINPMQQMQGYQHPLTPQVDPEALARYEQLLLGPYGDAFAQQLIKQQFPDPRDPTSLMQNVQAMGLAPGTPEYARTMREAVMKPQTAINLSQEARKPLLNDASKYVNQRGQSANPLMTAEEAVASGYSPQSESERTREQAEIKEDVKAKASSRGLGAMFKMYEEAFDEYQKVSLGGMAPWSVTAAEKADQVREAMVAWVAKNVLGTPGAEPSPQLYEDARRLVPDYSGPIDSYVFKDKMDQLRKLARARVEGDLKLPPGAQRID